MSDSFLRDHAKNLKTFAEQTKVRANADPDNFFLRLAARNQESFARSVERQACLEESERLGELIDLRLIGPRANGSIPLDWFVEAISPLTKAWKNAAHRLRYGVEAHRAVAEDVVSALNFKLAGLAPGSTHIFITGNAQPDLTGDSLLKETLKQTFRLLNASQTDFYDAVDAVGGKSAHQLQEFMKALDKGGFAIQFSWKSLDGARLWEGRPDEISRVRNLLASITEPERYPEVVSGSVAGITDTGRLSIRTASGKASIRFPMRLTDQVQRLKIRSNATLHVETSKYWDSVSKKDIYKRTLISVE
ncbi:hypothetical protein [Pseudomonas sp. MOIL14HWK12:I2]|uniref:hypothetical protein n=1 Tax=Pseudomonas sp. MOIL14HWK12:I2 TaxID=1033994 RepID=UPI000A066EC2|nr:hypothetical protein [Pseudomonas sp. MOIL14HWK12:I2]